LKEKLIWVWAKVLQQLEKVDCESFFAVFLKSLIFIRAQERANQIRQRKEREAELAKREKEIQRRKDGQLTAEAERQRTLNQAEQIRLDLEKERKEEAAHRQRVLDNLRRDKEDRERRQREAREGPTSDSQTTVTSSFTTSVTNLVDYARSKIQFRYDGPEGMRSFIGDFAAEDPFISAIDYVKKETGLRGSLTLRQLYPRRDFSESDGKSTMKDLGLVPNGVLLVLPSVSGFSWPVQHMRLMSQSINQSINWLLQHY
jgi:UBX domain